MESAEFFLFFVEHCLDKIQITGAVKVDKNNNSANEICLTWLLDPCSFEENAFFYLSYLAVACHSKTIGTLQYKVSCIHLDMLKKYLTLESDNKFGIKLYMEY